MKLEAIGHWGSKLGFSAKIGTMPGTIALVNRTRDFEVGKLIKYCDIDDVKGMSTSCAPRWSVGKIWKIENNRLYLERM